MGMVVHSADKSPAMTAPVLVPVAAYGQQCFIVQSSSLVPRLCNMYNSAFVNFDVPEGSFISLRCIGR